MDFTVISTVNASLTRSPPSHQLGAPSYAVCRIYESWVDPGHNEPTLLRHIWASHHLQVYRVEILPLNIRKSMFRWRLYGPVRVFCHPGNPLLWRRSRVQLLLVSLSPDWPNSEFQEDGSWKSKTADSCHHHGPKKKQKKTQWSLETPSAKAVIVTGCGLHHLARDFVWSE